MFLAVSRITVPASPEVIEDLGAVPPLFGIPEVIEHVEVSKIYFEANQERMAKNIDSGIDTDYYEITFNPAFRPSLKLIREKAGPRGSAPAAEIMVIENEDGDQIGSVRMPL